MTEAKVPDNKSDWKSIDIFLFSNGQQSSPPRKYHLVTDQLDWWKATLNFLAKAQYGSLHSMVDLYTVEGQKVETPMQLSHNTAYVAVVPPEIFIDAGYEKYLIKATRSWEKGQFRRSSNTAVINPEELKAINDKSNSDIRPYEFNINKEIRDGSVTLKTIVASMVDNQASVIVKPEHTNKHNTNNYSNLNAIKPLDGMSKSSIQHPATVKKNSILPSPPRSRKPSLKRKDSVKIITEKKSDRPSISSASNNKVPIRTRIYKPVQKHIDSLPETVLTKVEEIVNEVMSSSSIKKFNDKNSENKTLETENVSLEKEFPTVSNLYRNTNRDKPSIVVDPDIQLSHHVNRQGGVHELFDEYHQSIDPLIINNIEKKESETTINNFVDKSSTVDPALIERELYSPIISKVSKTDNDAAVIIKEGTVNLKLNIEIRSSPKDAIINPNIVSKKDSLIIPTQEKESQVNIEAKSEHDKPFHKMIASEMNGNEGNHKVIIVKCTCLNHGGDETKNIFPVNNGNSNILFFLPVLKLDEDCKRCDCKENKEINLTIQNSSIDYPVKKTTSFLSLYKERAEKIFSHSEITSRNNSTEIKLEANTIHDKNEITSVKRKSVAIREDQAMFPQMDKVSVPLEPDKSEFMTQKESTGILHKSMNKFTQTEWCDVLLEAKLQNDGHYSFYMPPLEMLKKYNL